MRQLIAAAAAAALALAAAPAAARPIDVVASFSVLGDIVAEIGGDRIALRTPVGPDGDAHTFEPSPADAKAVAEADLVIVNGLGLEAWMDRLARSSGYRGPLVVASEGVRPRTMVEDGATVTDPHAWQDLANGRIYVSN